METQSFAPARVKAIFSRPTVGETLFLHNKTTQELKQTAMIICTNYARQNMQTSCETETIQFKVLIFKNALNHCFTLN